ncbi:MAG: putative Ig domain-containing protein [Planctomycetaceae bacterium]|nr:putative Ig domain-containing protein [Planctomycetaceae bacterium]
MQPREKKLAILLGAAVGAYVLWGALDSWIFGPIANQQGLLTAAQLQLDDRESKQLAVFAAQSRLRDWRYESLPPNQLTAQREYQEWLMDLAALTGFIDARPELGPRRPLPRSQFFQIPVTIEARATLEQVARFLYHCERVALLHRFDLLDLVSPASDGNPLLQVKLTAVGLSLPESLERQHLFPRTDITSDMTDTTNTITVESAAGFPLAPGFQVKLNQELVKVTKIEGTTWTVERGIEGTVAAGHAAGSDVELFPVNRQAATRSFEDYRSLLQNSPFTKPSPPVEYKPEFSPAKLPVVTRGTPWQQKLTLTGWNPSGGPPVFSFTGDVPTGMKLDAETGTLSWNPDASIASGTYELHVRAASRINSEQSLKADLPVTLRDPNSPPVIEEIAPLKAFSGRPIEVQVSAADPDQPEGGLKFSLTGTVPEGAKIDATTGKLTWTPPLTMELGDYPLTVSVVDQGDPPQTVTKVVNVTVADDAALFTQYNGYFAANDKPEALLVNKNQPNARTYVQLGETFRVSEIEAQIVRIEPNHIELKIASQSYRLPLGSNFRQLLPMGPAADTAPVGTE